jgi:hypothetical protein
MEQRNRGGGENTLIRQKPVGESKTPVSHGVKSTQELKNPTEESRNHQWGFLGRPQGCSREKKSEK